MGEPAKALERPGDAGLVVAPRLLHGSISSRIHLIPEVYLTYVPQCPRLLALLSLRAFPPRHPGEH